MEFKELSIKSEVIKSIEEKGYSNPTDIQEKIIPLILKGKDVLGQSQTGTGKTLAFATAILTKVIYNHITQALILVPTRELAIQISKEIEELGKYTDIKTICVYGSSSIEDQIKKLKNGAEIVIGTPGRVKDLLGRKVLKVDNIKFFILDEADEMLSMGFQEELETIFTKVPDKKQVLLFSATMPDQIKKLAEKYMQKDYEFISVISDIKTADNITQFYYLVDDKTRIESMCRVMDYYNFNKNIIFCRTKRNADELLEKLSGRGYSVDVIHGDITQGQRIATLERFKKDQFSYLIATDVAARGIHIDDVNLIINYNLPESHEAYIHRIGRTGRANKKGIAVTFVKQKEVDIILSLEKYINASITKQEIPSMEDILKNRLSDITNTIDSLKDKEIKKDYFKKYIEELTIEQLKNIVSCLLQKDLKNNLGCNFDVDITLKDKPKKDKSRNTSDSVRVFMTIGSIDNITKKELLDFIEKKSGVPENSCFNVEVMPKFTFANVKKEYFDKIIKKCNDVKLKNRIIRIEKAKK